MRSALRLVVYFLFSLTIFAATLAFAQQPAPSAEAEAKPGVTLVQPPVAVDEKFVRERFGDQFTLVKEFPGMLADLDGDGVEDLVIVAKAKSPMLDEGALGFKVVDAYNAFFGFGDPHITAGFGADDPTRQGFVLLVIHGAGADAWHAAQPKAKFVLINIPFKAVSMRRVMINKKAVMAIALQEYGAMENTSAVYWESSRNKKTGRYKYEPLGASME